MLHLHFSPAATDQSDSKGHIHFFTINEPFHAKLHQIADNKWAGQMVAYLRKVMKLNRHNSLLKEGHIKES